MDSSERTALPQKRGTHSSLFSVLHVNVAFESEDRARQAFQNVENCFRLQIAEIEDRTRLVRRSGLGLNLYGGVAHGLGGWS